MTPADPPTEDYAAMAEEFERMMSSACSVELAHGYQALAEGYRTLARHTAATRVVSLSRSPSQSSLSPRDVPAFPDTVVTKPAFDSLEAAPDT